MKNEQREQARDLYFSTNLSKTEIAARIGVNRRTVMLWTQEGNWDSLKKSATSLPSIVAEKCYHILDRYTSRMLDTVSMGMTLDIKNADFVSKMASSIRKLKNRSTANETMELFNFLLEHVKKTNPEFAGELVPVLENFMESRAAVDVREFLLEEFNSDGTLPQSAITSPRAENYEDRQDTEAFQQELRYANGDYDVALEAWLKGPEEVPNAA